MKSRITQLMFFVAALCVFVPAHAYDCAVDGICYDLNTSNRTAKVTYFSDDGFVNMFYYTDIVTIPGRIIYDSETYKVTSIESSAFCGCSNLKSVTIPNSMTNIGENAFSGCTGLINIVVEKNNTVYDSRGNCNAIIETATNTLISGCQSTIIPNTVTSIGESAFSGCTSLTSVTIPESVTSIGENAFSGCTGLTSVTYNAEVCREMWTSSYSVFNECTNLTMLTIGEKVMTIPEYAFRGCTGLESVIFNAEMCRKMGTGSCPVFNECTNLTTLIIGEKVTIIPDFAFRDCAGLTSVTIPNSVMGIGESAFSGCSGLTSVTIPESVTSIEGNAFSDCTGMTTVTIPNSMTSIGWGIFSGCTGLTSVAIPESVTCIDGCVFRGCTGLTSVTIPNSVTSIGESAFEGCTGLESVIFNAEKCSEMGISYSTVFNECTNLSMLTIGEKVKMIPAYAFKSCSTITKIVCAALNPPVCNTDVFDGIDKTNCALYVPQESVELYKAANTWKDFYIIEGMVGVDDITVDGEDAETLYDVYNIQGVKVGSGLRRADMSDALPHGIYIFVSPNGTSKVRL